MKRKLLTLAVTGIVSLSAAFLSCTEAEATVVPVSGGVGYKVDIDDSSVFMRGPGHANVIITPYYARWNPSYPVEVLWGKGYAVYRLDKDGNRKGTETPNFALAIANYMSEHY